MIIYAPFTIAFLNSLDLKTKNDILTNIANHYGITNEEAYQEVTDNEAENLIDYLSGDMRETVSVLMQNFTTICFDPNLGANMGEGIQRIEAINNEMQKFKS